jgi:hypothetical protein
MVAVQNLKGEIIQLILSRKGGGGYVPCNRSEVTHSSSYYYICKTVFYCFRYNAVIHACCLQEDMESFISGSETEVHIPTNLIIRQTKETTRFAFDASLLSSQH